MVKEKTMSATSVLDDLDRLLSFGQIDHVFPVLSFEVGDGDTIKVLLDGSFHTRFEYACRVAAVDTPEKNTAAGQAVKHAVEKWFRDLPAEHLRCVSTDHRNKFAGRFLGTFFDRRKPTETLTHWLIREQLARPYDGGRKPVWFADELDAIEQRALTLAA